MAVGHPRTSVSPMTRPTRVLLLPFVLVPLQTTVQRAWRRITAERAAKFAEAQARVYSALSMLVTELQQPELQRSRPPAPPMARSRGGVVPEVMDRVADVLAKAQPRGQLPIPRPAPVTGARPGATTNARAEAVEGGPDATQAPHFEEKALRRQQQATGPKIALTVDTHTRQFFMRGGLVEVQCAEGAGADGLQWKPATVLEVRPGDAKDSIGSAVYDVALNEAPDGRRVLRDIAADQLRTPRTVDPQSVDIIGRRSRQRKGGTSVSGRSEAQEMRENTVHGNAGGGSTHTLQTPEKPRAVAVGFVSPPSGPSPGVETH